jgi:hypothetical protein
MTMGSGVATGDSFPDIQRLFSMQMYEDDRRSSALRHSTLLGSSHCILSMAFACLKSGRLYGQSSTSPHVRVFVLLLVVLKHDTNPEAEFLDEIHTKVLGVFLLAIHSHLHILQLCLEFSISSNSLNLLNISSDFKPLRISTVHLLYTVKEKVGKPDRKSCHLPYGLRNPYRNLKSQNLKIIPRNLNEVVCS